MDRLGLVYTPYIHILFMDAWHMFVKSFTEFRVLPFSGWSPHLMGG